MDFVTAICFPRKFSSLKCWLNPPETHSNHERRSGFENVVVSDLRCVYKTMLSKYIFWSIVIFCFYNTFDDILHKGWWLRKVRTTEGCTKPFDTNKWLLMTVCNKTNPCLIYSFLETVNGMSCHQHQMAAQAIFCVSMSGIIA